MYEEPLHYTADGKPGPGMEERIPKEKDTTHKRKVEVAQGFVAQAMAAAVAAANAPAPAGTGSSGSGAAPAPQRKLRSTQSNPSGRRNGR